jgi:DNA-directed RNA polymerase subunit M/transcription elongation factor TFIIS
MSPALSQDRPQDVKIFGGAATVPKLVDRKDYDNWSYLFTITCATEGYGDHLDGSVKRPEPVLPPLSNSVFEVWEAKDMKLRQAISTAVDMSMLVYVRGKTTAALQWSALSAVFAPKTKTRKFQIHHTLITTKFPDSYEADTMQNYIDTMAKHRRLLSEQGTILDDDWYSYLLLKHLPDSFSGLRTVIEASDSYDLDSVQSKLLEEWETRVANGTLVSSEKGSVPVMAITKKEKKDVIICSYCGKKNHTAEKCYKRIAEEKEKAKEKEVVLVNYATLRETHEHYLYSVATSTPTESTYALATIPSSLSKSQVEPFSVDSGAGRHITGDVTILHDWVESPLEVTLANKEKVWCKGYGCVELLTDLDHTITIRQVYYLPNGHNLFSVGQLRGTGYAWLLDGSGGKFFDPNGKVIGTATLTGASTYTFNASAKTLPVPISLVTEDYNLLHRRHGHV